MSLIDKIKELFTEEVAQVETPIAFVDVKTADGMILRISDMAVDATVVEINENGENPVEDGTYTLEDGNQIVVVGGLIKEIIEAAPVDQPTDVPAEGAPIDTPTQMNENFLDVTLKDGPIAHIVTAVEGSITVGDKLMIDNTEAGPGEYETLDGLKLIVGDMGVIEEVKEDHPSDMPEDVTSDMPEDASPEVIGVVNNLKELINQVKELKAQFETEIQSIKEENIELKERVEKFASAPSAESTQTTVSLKKADKASKLEFFGRK